MSTIISRYWKGCKYYLCKCYRQFYPLVRLKIENTIALFDKRWSRSNTYHERKNLSLLLPSSLPPSFFYLSSTKHLQCRKRPTISHVTRLYRWRNNGKRAFQRHFPRRRRRQGGRSTFSAAGTAVPEWPMADQQANRWEKKLAYACERVDMTLSN